MVAPIFRVAPEFSNEVKKWARTVHSFGWGEGEALTIVREWWMANRDAMRAGNNGEVTPGRTLPQWLEGLPEIDPPFDPDKPAVPIRYPPPDPICMKVQYADYLEAKRTGKPYPPPLQTIPPSAEDGADGTSGMARRWIVIAIALVVTAFIVTGAWMLRHSRQMGAGGRGSGGR